MLRKLLPLILIFQFSLGQNTIGNLSITNEAYDALTLVSTHNKAYLIDNCGQVVNEWTSQYPPGVSVYLLPNGNLLRAGRLEDGSSNIGFGGQGGIIELFDWDGNLIWSYIDSSMQSRHHHDVFPMPNGNILILAATVISEQDAIQAGRNPSLLQDNELYNERIYEVQPIGANFGNIVWEWNAIDHVIQDFDNTKDNFGSIADNPGKIDLNFLNGFDPINNWLHINSIQYDEEFDQIVISSRRFSELWIIDHNTTTLEAEGSDGDLIYRWGNPQAYGQGTESDRILYGQHSPYLIPTGFPNERKIMLFNNGFQRTPQFSEVMIINPPVDSNGNYAYVPGTAFEPLTTDYTFPEIPPTEDSDFFSAIVSNGQQLPNGNILVNEGRDARFFELNSNNDVVWEYILPINNGDGTAYTQGVELPISNFAFRAIKYDKTYSAFDGRDLTPSNPLEINPDISSCLNVLSISEVLDLEWAIYPNPTSDYLNIDSKFPVDKIEIYDLNGSKVYEKGNNASLNLSELNSGIYFIKVWSEGRSTSKKIIKR